MFCKQKMSNAYTESLYDHSQSSGHGSNLDPNPDQT